MYTCIEQPAGGSGHQASGCVISLSTQPRGETSHCPHLAEKASHTWVTVSQPHTQGLPDPKPALLCCLGPPASTLQAPAFSSLLTLDFFQCTAVELSPSDQDGPRGAARKQVRLCFLSSSERALVLGRFAAHSALSLPLQGGQEPPSWPAPPSPGVSRMAGTHPRGTQLGRRASPPAFQVTATPL